MLDMPVGTALQMRRRQGIVFGANDLANLASGTHYYAYIETTNDSKDQYVRIAEVKDGTITRLNGDRKLDDILANVETVGLDSIELSVYFTKDGVIKLYLQDICIYTATGRTISGSQYGLCLADSISGSTTRVTANYAFNSLSTKGFGDFIYLEDGSAYALKSSVAYSKETIKGNDVWYSFEGTDFGTADTGFLLGTHKDADYSGEWEGKIHGYCLFVYNNGKICIGAFGIEYYNESKQQNSTWHQLGTNNLKSTTYWMKDADTVSAESEGIYHIRVHQVYDPVANTNTFDVYVGGIYISTFTDASGRAFSPDGGHYGYRNKQAGVFLANSADMVEYPDYLDTAAKEHSLVNRSVKRAIAYDEATGFFRNAFLDDQNINMSNEKVTIPTTGKTTVYYSVDMQKLRYGMNADDGLVFGASTSDANYNGGATWYGLVIGDQRDAGAVRERNLRLLKYTGAIEEGQSAPAAFPEVSNGYSTDKITTLTKFDYTPGDVVCIKVAVEYDFDNNTTTINAYANGVHTFKFVDTVANEGKNAKTPSVGTYALTGTGVGVRTEASQTSWANLTVSLTEMDDLPPVQETPEPSVPSAPVTFDGTAIWVSIVSLASLAVGVVASFNKKERA